MRITNKWLGAIWPLLTLVRTGARNKQNNPALMSINTCLNLKNHGNRDLSTTVKIVAIPPQCRRISSIEGFQWAWEIIKIWFVRSLLESFPRSKKWFSSSSKRM